MKISIIIPSYNEQNSITDIINKLNNVKFPSFVDEKEIIIIDDCSEDNTWDIVQELKNANPNIIIHRHAQNMGKGAAVKSGLKYFTGDVFIVQDADLELSPDDIPRMIEAMIQLKVEFVNGSRYLAGISRPLASYKRYLANRFFSFLVSALIDVRLTDIACGYKLVHRNIISKIDLKEKRFGFEAELILKALRLKKNNVTEIPVQYYPRSEQDGKKLKNIDAFKILKTIIKYGLLKRK